jgi:hypothetical protein
MTEDQEQERLRDQKSLFAPIKSWLESNGFRALITGGKQTQLVVPIKDLLPTQTFVIPDVVGVKDSDVVVVEAETDPRKFLEVIGKAVLWKTMATFVYVGYPRETCQEFRILEKFGIGLLSVSDGVVNEVIRILPSDSADLFKVLELHPVDFVRQAELCRQIKRLVGV